MLHRAIAFLALALASFTAASARDLSVSDGLTVEGNQWCATVTAPNAVGQSATFRYETIGGEATAPGDFTHKSGQQTVRKNTTKITFCGPTTEDSAFENDERFYVKITPVSNATIVRAVGTQTLRDDDVAPLPPVQCPDGTQVPAGATCPPVSCPDGSTVPNGQQCPIVVPPPVQCPDGSTVPAGQTCPEPPPVQQPAWKPSPTPDGEIPINGSEGKLQASVIPGSAAPDVLGAFRFVCRSAAINRDDPLVYPGQPGKSHWHNDYGWSQIDAFDTYASLQTEAGYTTCEAPSDDPGNRSAYWTSGFIITLPAGAIVPPSALKNKPDLKVDAEGRLLESADFHWLADIFELYYKRRPASDPVCFEKSVWGPQMTGCAPLPNGQNMIFGFDMVKLQDSPSRHYYRCVGGSNDSLKSHRIPDILAVCPAGATLHAVITAQPCFDPRYIDSPNHQDHLSYMVRHPWGAIGCQVPASGATEMKIQPQLSLLAMLRVTPEVRAAYEANPEWGVHLSSDEHVKAMKPEIACAGCSYHGDLKMSWLVRVRDKWNNFCLNKLLTCSAGQLGNGEQLLGGGAPYYPSLGRTSWQHPTPVVPVRPEGYGADW